MLRSSQGLSAETVDGHRCQIEVVLAKTLNGIMFFYIVKKTSFFSCNFFGTLPISILDLRSARPSSMTIQEVRHPGRSCPGGCCHTWCNIVYIYNMYI